MEVIHPHCAGLDVQKRTVVACCITVGATGEKFSQTRSFSKTTQDLLALSDWLGSNSISHVALPLTEEDWKKVYHLLEANFNVLVVNTQRINNVPGRKTNTADAEWMAELLRHGLVRDSFIHPTGQRDLRDLIRHRHNLMQERTNVVNHLYKVLESANVKLLPLMSNIMHTSARAILLAIAQGQTSISELTNLAELSVRQQQQSEPAYFRHVRSHHRFLIANHLNHIDFLDQQISVFNTKIAEYIQTTIAQTETSESSQIQLNTPTSATAHTAKLIPSWEEALAAFLNGGNI